MSGAGPFSVRTTCPYCGVGCGIVAERGVDGTITIRGDETHPANRGRLCSKGAALAETIGPDGRLLRPEINGRPVAWDVALDEVTRAFSAAIDTHGPDAVAFYVSGQLLTEDYYVANKLMKGFIGSANIDTNSRLCMASSVAGHKRAFGADIVPGCYEDLDLADLVVFVGSNAAWCHPVLYQRVMARRSGRGQPRIVVVDPRRTATAEGADLHLPIRPGADAILFNGLLAHLAEAGAVNEGFVAACTRGFDEALTAAWRSAASVEAVAIACGLAVEDVALFFRWFARTERVVTLYSQGINQSATGSDKVNAIINCHLATGRIGRAGMGPLSLTGQPNAMGGREVGGLANQLAAHIELNDRTGRARVHRFWKSPAIATRPGLKAVDLFEAVGRGEIKALWIMSTNPVVSLPNADSVRAALARCPFVVVSDCVRRTDTNGFADVLLPAAAWGEKDGTVTNSERRISRQRAFIEPPGEARPDWWIVCQVAKRMGFADAFSYDGPAAIFREHAALSGIGNRGARDFDISAFATLDDDGYEALTPIQWPVTTDAPGGTARMLATSRFFTADGRARLLPVTPQPPCNAPDAGFPLVLNTGRVRDHWHTMTRTGRSPRLSAHMVEPVMDIHPDDAATSGIDDGALARIDSHWGAMVARVRVTDAQPRGSVFAPIHWTDQFAPGGRVGPLVNPDRDPVSGQPESKHTPVAVRPFAAAWHGFTLTRDRYDPPATDYWALSAGKGHVRCEMAAMAMPADWDGFARTLLNDGDPTGEWIAYRDPGAGQHRFALVRDGRLAGCLFVARDPKALPSRQWLGSLFESGGLDATSRGRVLAGAPPEGRKDDGAIVCACFAVGVNRLVAAIAGDGLVTMEAIGAALRAGTNCGSCRPEIAALIAAHAAPVVVETSAA